jgi:hypothetical protein
MTKDYIYTPASTDITLRWAKLYNYVPASEQAKYQRKWRDFKATMAKTVEDLEPEIKQEKVIEWKKLRKQS